MMGMTKKELVKNFNFFEDNKERIHTFSRGENRGHIFFDHLKEKEKEFNHFVFMVK